MSTVPLPHTQNLLRLDAESQTLRSVTYELEVVRGPAAGKVIALDGPLVLGNDPTVGLNLNDPTVSRLHAEISPRADGVRVRDLGSTNGIFSAGLRVNDVVLDAGLLEMGRSSVLVRKQEKEVEVPTGPTQFGACLGQSRVMRHLFGVLTKVAASDSSVLMLGETGTGKDLLARAVHDNSKRREAPFVVVDCASLAPSVIESELFGHVGGAFTGATSGREGAFVHAHQGTLFLDEIGELPLDLQPRLLRVLESSMVKPVGSDRQVQVDIRVIAATHRDLEKDVREGRFRKDLFYRLAVVILKVPPLRERPEDILLLAQHFGANKGGTALSFGPDLLGQLATHSWPGNVRELRNVVDRLLFGGDVQVGPKKQTAPELPYKDAKEQLLDAFTKDYLARLFVRCHGNVSQMARESGINRNHVAFLIERYGVKKAEP